VYVLGVVPSFTSPVIRSMIAVPFVALVGGYLGLKGLDHASGLVTRRPSPGGAPADPGSSPAPPR
jgi:hypothetical protein